ncbi:MAG: thioredoxin family protein, partial [Bacteroidales bacterium]
TQTINWISLEEAQVRYKSVPKPMMLFFYTDWCKFCKEMDKTTFSNEQIGAYINQHFYCVRINAEGYDTLTWNDTIYINPGGKERSTHDLARALLGHRLTYPTIMFLNQQYQFRFVVPGMVDIVKFEPMLVYVLEQVFLTENYEPFEASFIRTFRPDEAPPLLSLAEATPIVGMPHEKKNLITIQAEWCNSCKVMNHATFLDSTIITLLENHFDVGSMHISSQDTIYWFGKVYIPNSQGGVHPFVSEFAGSQMMLPLMLLFDEEGQLLTPLPRYQPPASLARVLKYFGEGHYKLIPWNEYLEQN